MNLFVLLVVLGLVGGFFSGLLGLGGSIIMVPLLLYVPQLFGFPALDMKVVSAISIVQVTFASLTAVMVHMKNRLVSRPLVTLMGLIGAVASFAGGFLSEQMPADTLLVIFAFIATFGAAMMLLPRTETEVTVPADEIPFNRPLAAAIALGVGVIGGMIGAPGAFVYVPLLMYLLHIPTRITLGSTLAIVLISSVAGLFGKLVTGQIPITLSLALVVGAIPGAQWGGRLSHRVPIKALKWMLTSVVIISTLKVWGEAWPILFGR